MTVFISTSTTYQKRIVNLNGQTQTQNNHRNLRMLHQLPKRPFQLPPPSLPLSALNTLKIPIVISDHPSADRPHHRTHQILQATLRPPSLSYPLEVSPKGSPTPRPLHQIRTSIYSSCLSPPHQFLLQNAASTSRPPNVRRKSPQVRHHLELCHFVTCSK